MSERTKVLVFALANIIVWSAVIHGCIRDLEDIEHADESSETTRAHLLEAD
jgi:hypothetical protein